MNMTTKTTKTTPTQPSSSASRVTSPAPAKRLDRVGGLAGLLVPVACGVAVYSTAVDGPNLRQGAFPWATVVACVLAALTTAAVARRHQAVWGRVRRTIARATVAGLAGVATFFAVLGGEDLLNRTLGTDRVLSETGPLVALGTLAVSLLTLVVVPVGLLLVGVFAARARVLSPVGRTAMLAVGPALVLGAVLTGVTEALWISLVWPLVLAGCWAVLGAALLRDGSDR